MPVPKQPTPTPFAEKMKNVPPPGRRRKEPLWKGPEVDGITFSMLSRFLVCRERFRLHVMEGLRPPYQFNHRIEYGQMWHVCEQAMTTPPPEGQRWGVTDWWMHNLKIYANSLCREYPTAQDQVMKWLRICLMQFPMYLRYWEDHPDMGQDYQPLLSEFVFSIPYHLPSGRTVFLRGKWDSVDLAGQGVQRGIWLQENKTKGDIDPLQIQRQLSFDLQTMIYLTALYEVHDDSEMPEELRDNPIRGVRYNVVRRPLSGGKGSIVQKKGSKNVPPETDDEYYARLGAYIEEEPETYFMRWNVTITKEDVKRFRERCLTPVLEQVCDWYDWMGKLRQEPFDTTGNAGVHWQHPFGVFNVLDEGGSTDLDEYLATGNEVGLERTDKLFTELEG